MNTIKIFLADSGRVADMHKDFPLYQGQFNDKLLNIYVPTSILAPHFNVEKYIGKASGVSLPTSAFLYEFVNTHTLTERDPEEGDVIGYIKVQGVSDQEFYIYTYTDGEWTSEQVDSLGTVNSVAGTSVKLAVVATERDGKLYQSKNYYMRYLKTMSCQGVEYALYERKLPKEFTTFVGQGENAPIMVFNVVDVNNKQDTILSVVTSQTCALDVLPSSDLDQDPEEDTGAFDDLWAQVNTNTSDILDKQNKEDNGLNTESKMVVGAINELAGEYTTLNGQIATNAANIASNTGRIAQNERDIADIKAEQLIQNSNINENASDIADLKAIVGTGENYIGNTLGLWNPNSYLELPDIINFINTYVYQTLGRSPEGGDVVFYIQQVVGGTDRNYKFIYSGAISEETEEPIGWTFYEIPPVESASNTDKGVIQGNYKENDTTHKVQVNVINGQIEDVYLVNNSNEHVRLGQFLNGGETVISDMSTQVGTNTQNISIIDGKVGLLQTTQNNILSGTTAVGLASKAEADGLNRNIATTYLTQNAGVTKTQMREYALPRTFNDVSYLTSTGYSDEIPESVSPIYSATSEAVGDTELFSAEKTLANTEFELGSKNSSTNTIYVGASAICNVQFRLTTEIYVNNEWVTASVDLTDNVQFESANEIKKVSFGGTFALLDEVYKLSGGDKFRQTLEVVTSVSQSITFDVYSNETYPSVFYLNTTSQTIQVAQGDLGEVLTLKLTGVYDSVEDTVTFDIPVGFIINNSTLTQFELTLPTVTAPDELTDATKVAFTQDSQDIIALVIPTKADGRTVPTLKDMNSVLADGKLYFTGVFELDNGDIYLYTSITLGGDTDNLVTLDTDQSITGKKTITDTSLDFKQSSASGNASWQIEEDQYGQLAISRTYNNTKSRMAQFNGNSFLPEGNNGNLGSSSKKWQDLYLSRNLTDGTNSIAISDIANNNDILLKPLTLTSTTLTDEQYNLISNYNCILTADFNTLTYAKKGTILTKPFEYNNTLRGMYLTENKIGTYLINMTTKEIGNGAQDIVLYQVANINTGKVDFSNNATITKDSSDRINLNYSNSAKVKVGSAETIIANRIGADSDNSQDIGRSAVRWKDLYLAGNLTDGTDSVAINKIATTDTDQTISGVKTFSAQPVAKSMKFVNNTSSPTGSYFEINNDNGYNAKIRMNGKGLMFTAGSVYPSETSGEDLGASGYKWRNIYLSGNLSDGTNDIAVADIASKNFVNSSIATNTANFIGTFASVSDLEAYSGTVTNNDYAFVVNGVVEDNGGDWATFNDLDAYDKTLLTNFDYAWVVNGSNFDLYRFDIENQEWVLRVQNTTKASVTLNTAYNRYKATVSGATITWLFEYTLNNSSFTAVQWEAINSGANTTNIAQIGTNATNISNLQTDKQNVIDSTHKLSADLVEDGTTNKVFTATEQTKLSGIESGAQVNTVTSVNTQTGAVVLDADDISDSTTTNKFVTANDKSTWNAKQNAIDSSHKLSADLVDDTSTTNKFVTSNDISTWNAKQNALPTTTTAGQVLKSTSTAGTLEWGTVQSGGVTDVKINNVSVVSSGVANLSTNTAYNASTNKIATMSDVPAAVTSVNGLSGGTISSGVTVNGNIEGQYVKGTWLYTSSATDNASWTDVYVNNGGWLYKRSKAGIKTDLGIPSNIVSVQVYNSEADALTASQADPNKLCLY